MLELVELIKGWQNDLKVRDTSIHTQIVYINDLHQCFKFFNTHCGEEFNFDLFRSLKAQDLRAWLMNRRNQKFNPRSSRRALSALKTFTRFLKRQKYLKDHVVLNFKGPRVAPTLPRPITPIQAIDLLENLEIMEENPWVVLRNKALFMLLYGTGIRIGEALALNQEQIGDNFIKILGKGKKQRYVPILPKIKVIMNQYLKVIPFDTSPISPIFYGVKGKRLQAAIVEKILQKYRKLYNLPDSLTPHALRHSCATHLIEKGENLRLVQELLGHSSLASTQIYTQVNQEQLLHTYNNTHPRTSGSVSNDSTFTDKINK